MATDRERAARQNALSTLRKLFPGKRVELSAQLPDDRTNLATRAPPALLPRVHERDEPRRPWPSLTSD